MELLDREYTYVDYASLRTKRHKVEINRDPITLREILALDLYAMDIFVTGINFYLCKDINLRLGVYFSANKYQIFEGLAKEAYLPLKWMEKINKIFLAGYFNSPEAGKFEVITRKNHLDFNHGGKGVSILRHTAEKITEAPPLLDMLEKHFPLPGDLNKVIVEEFVGGEECHKFERLLALLR